MLTCRKVSSYRQSFLNLCAVSMKLLWLSVWLSLVLGQTEFGTSRLKNSQLCAQWSCINTNLGLGDELPRREQYEQLLRGLLPPGAWQAAAGPALDACYGERPRRYTNTCPGQALLHCTVEQLIENCPNEHWITKDACAPVTSLAGLQYMFSQSRYSDIEANLPSERRPGWFLRNYFNVKCCDLPPLFNETLLKQCGFNSFIYYYQQRTKTHAPLKTYKVEKKKTKNGEVLEVVWLDDESTTPNVEEYDEADPLNCCDIHEFISPSWRSECGFQLTWNPESRLSIKNITGPLSTTTTTEAPKSLKAKDVKMVPHSCEKNNCVFRSLNIVSESGVVDIDAFSKLLNNLTDMHPSWSKARGRVHTKCLSRPIRDYDYDCQINKVLACTFDVLTENCPNNISPDVCRHATATNNEVICQISSSKYRPKNRRLFCAIPNLVRYDVLDQCNLSSLIHLEYVPETIFKPRTLSASSVMCNDTTPSTMCLMERMGVLNKYSFMDYFKMKDRIREFSQGEWYPYRNALTAVFQSVPLYKQHCSSPKKLLNVIDTMLTTCPYSKRRLTPECNKLFSNLNGEILKNSDLQSDQIHNTFGHVFNANQHLDIGLVPKDSLLRVESKPIYDFGLLNSNDAPPVKIIDLKPKTERPPLVLLPVYQRMPFQKYNQEHIMRSDSVIDNVLQNA